MIVVGIDPDSKAHGVATYVNNKLTDLESLNNLEIGERVRRGYWGKKCLFVIENVNGVSAAFGARDSNKNIHVKLKMAQSIGMCKQAQIELENMLLFWDVKFKHFGISKSWKKDKDLFEKITGWKGRSNEDTRSAAYFGWLGLK
jgi:hypothetical protein